MATEARAAPGAPAGAVERAEERLALHELLRVGLARQEDLRLLQQVVEGSLALPPAAVTQAFKECQYREEWRCMREAQLIAQVASTSLASLPDASMQVIAQHMEQVKQMQAQQRTTRTSIQAGRTHSTAAVRPSPSSPHPMHGPLSSSPGPSSSLGAALGLYSSPPVGHRVVGAMTPAGRRTASTAAAGALQPLRNAPSGGKQISRALTPSPGRTSHTSAPVLMTTEQLRRQLSHGSTTSNSQPPTPATPTRTSAHTTTATPRTNSAGGVRGAPRAERSHSMPSTPPRTAPPAPQPASPATAPEQPRFQRLLKLQGTLLSGLQQHAQVGGAQAAIGALQESINQMQIHFQECMTEAGNVKGGGGDGTTSAIEGVPTSKRTDWSRLLQLGQLGLTSQDVARLNHIRQCVAARQIQRAVKRYLRRRRHKRAVEEANAQAARAAQRLQEHAVLVIQRWWRGYRARCRCAALRAEALAERRQGVVQRIRRWCAVLQIQRSWRMHRKRRRAWQAMCLLKPIRTDATGSNGIHVSGISTGGDGTGPGRAIINGLPEISGSGPTLDTKLDLGQVTEQQQRAALVIQAAARGWLVRRSTGLWWARSVAALRVRRGAHRAWEAHRACMVETLDLQEQLVRNLSAEARAQQIISRDMEREQQVFETNWLKWLAAQHETALSQPLPRGWVPHRDPATGQDVFVDTRTGALHAHHPGVLQLKAFAAAQRDQAMQHVQERVEEAARRIVHVQAAAAHERSELLAQLHRAQIRHLGTASSSSSSSSCLATKRT